MYTKDDDSSGDIFVRAEDKFTVSAEILYEKIVDLPTRGDYDDMFECGDIYEKISADISIVRQ